LSFFARIGLVTEGKEMEFLIFFLIASLEAIKKEDRFVERSGRFHELGTNDGKC